MTLWSNFLQNRLNFVLEHKISPCHQQRFLQVYWKMFASTTDGIVVENFILCNILYILQFILFCFINSYSIVILLMLCIKFYFVFVLFHSIMFIQLYPNVWVIMLLGYVMYLNSYVMADAIAIFYFILYHFISFLFKYTLMLWVIMFEVIWCT